MALGPRTWTIACVCGPKHAYVGTLLCTQLGFQRHKKDKFSTIIAEVWNESYIVWEPFKTSFFSTIKCLTWYTFKIHRNPTRKIQDSLKIVNQKGVFYKTPSSQFCLIETFSGSNPFS